MAGLLEARIGDRRASIRSERGRLVIEVDGLRDALALAGTGRRLRSALERLSEHIDVVVRIGRRIELPLGAPALLARPLRVPVAGIRFRTG